MNLASGLLLYSQTGQQPGRTSKIIRFERHRSSHHLLERQMCYSSNTSSSTLAPVTHLYQRSSQTYDQSHRYDETAPYYPTTTLYSRGLHEEPLRHGQPLQPRGVKTLHVLATLYNHILHQTLQQLCPPHFHVDGDTLIFPSAPLTSIATGSLQNKIFPPKTEIFKSLQKAFDTWHRKHSVPSLPLRHITALWRNEWSLHNHHLHKHVTHKDITSFKQLFPGSVLHNEDKRATSLRIYCPCLYFEH